MSKFYFSNTIHRSCSQSRCVQKEIYICVQLLCYGYKVQEHVHEHCDFLTPSSSPQSIAIPKSEVKYVIRLKKDGAQAGKGRVCYRLLTRGMSRAFTGLSGSRKTGLRYSHGYSIILYVQEVVTRPKILNRTILSN